MLHKICASDAKLNDRHLIGRPSAEKYRWKIHWRKHITTTLPFMPTYYTHVTDALHMTGRLTFFSTDEHHDWRAIHSLRVTGISHPSVARLIKQYRWLNEFYLGVTAMCLYMTGQWWYTLPVAANRRRTPQSWVYGKTCPSLLGLFGVVMVLPYPAHTLSIAILMRRGVNVVAPRCLHWRHQRSEVNLGLSQEFGIAAMGGLG
jgi:hypothetical protein